jgi:tRNA-dihydrouridine synthase
MKLEMAPLEGLTTYIFRNAYAKYFGHMDKYYTPFLSLHKEKEFNHKERQEVLPENNKGLCVVPQVLTNSSEDFLRAARTLKELGYEEVNINLGCPSGTVVPKGKGAGMLEEPKGLEQFLEKCFAKTPVKISVKTRLGMDEEEEWERLLTIYNGFPLEELIVHARVREDYYKRPVRWEAFGKALSESRCAVCYNGDIFTVEDYARLTECFPKLEAVMLGRGLLRNPGLAEEINTMEGNSEQEKSEDYDTKLRAFHDELYMGYQRIMSGDRNVLFKMKEFWSYLLYSFPNMEKRLKSLHKLKTCAEYESWLRVKN